MPGALLESVSFGGFVQLLRRQWKIAAAVAVILLPVLGVGCGKNGEPQVGGVTLPPLTGQERSLYQAKDPDHLVWAERLRQLFEALPAEAKETMLEEGEYAFRLGDLTKKQAKMISEYVVERRRAAAEGEDLSQFVFKFGRISEDPDHVRFSIGTGEGFSVGPPIAMWPASEEAK